MLARNSRRGVSVLGILMAAAGAVQAGTWDGGGGDNNMKTAGNWVGDVAPVPGEGLVFDGASRLTPNNNFTAGTSFAGITFAGTAAGPFTLSGNQIALTAGVTDNTQSFAHTINLPLLLNATQTFNIATLASLSVAGVISGAGGINETGAGLLTLSGANTFTGPVSVGSGATLSISSDGNLGGVPGAATAGKVVLSGGGTLRTTANLTLSANRGITLGPGAGTFDVGSGTTLTYNGVMANDGGAGGLTKLSFGNIALGGANTYTGATAIRNGTLNLDFTQGTAPASNIINSASALTLGGANAGLGNTSNATILVTGKAGAASSQTFASTTLDVGPAVIRANSGAGGSATLNLGAITANTGSVANFVLPASGSIKTTTGNTNGILGAWATVGTGAGNDVRNGVFQGPDFAAVDGSGNIVAYTGYAAWSSGTMVSNGFGAASNVRVSNGASLAMAADNANVTVDINTLSLSNTVTDQAISVGVGNTLRFGKVGGIFRQDTGTNVTMYVGQNGPGQHNQGIITAGGAPNEAGTLIVTVNANSESSGALRLGSILADNGTGKLTLVKAGPGNLKIDGLNTYSGDSYILAGRVQMTGGENGGTVNPNAFGTGTIKVYPGAYVFPGSFTMTNNWELAGVGTNAEPVGAIRMGNGTIVAGNIALVGDARVGGGNGGNTAITGAISGAFNFDMGSAANSGGSGTQFTISNPNNSWTGNTTILGRTGGSAGNTIIKLGASEVIPNGTGKGNLIFGINGVTVSTMTLDLNGFSETVNGVASAAGTTVTNAVILNNAAGPSTLTLGDNDQTATFGGIIQNGAGQVSVTKVGSGVQTLTGNNSYGGDTNINRGAIAVTGSLNNGGNVLVNTSAGGAGALYGTGSVGNVTTAAATGANKAVIAPGTTGVGSVGTLQVNSLSVGAGSNLLFDLVTPGGSDLINSSNPVTFSGLSSIVPSGVPTAGTYTVLTAPSISGTAPTLVAAGDSRLTFAYNANSWTVNPGNNQIIIDVSGSVANLTWTGASGNTWDLHTSPNWTSAAPANPNLYFNGDNVTFDDTGSNTDIVIGAALSPGNMTFNNGAKNYSIAGGGSLGGVGSLTKSGTGTLTMATANTFSGGTTLSAGTLNVNNNGALGTGTTLVINGGTLGNTSGQAVTVSANPNQTWNADITFNGTSPLNLGTGSVSMVGGTSRTITVSDSVLTVGGPITDNGSNFTLDKAGTGTLVLGGQNNIGGPVNINAGTLRIGDFGALGGNTANTVTVASGASLDVGGFAAANVANGLALPVVISGTGAGGVGAITNSGTLAQQNALQQVTLAADASVGGTGRFDIRGGPATLNLAGFTLTKTGTSQFSIVDGTVTAGNIVVSQGTLAIEGITNVQDNGDGKTISVAGGTTLQFFNNTGTVTRPVVMTGAATINNASGADTNSTVGANVDFTGGNLSFAGGNATANLTMTGTLTGGGSSLTKSGGSVLVLQNATNAYTGGTNVNGGVLQFAALGSLGTGPLAFGGGTLRYPNGFTSDVTTAYGSGVTVNAGGGTIDTNGNTVTLAGNISGAGGLGVRGGATVTLTGNNTYAGVTTVQNGTLVIGSATAFPAGSGIVLGNANNEGAVFDMAGRSLTVSSLNTVGQGGSAIGSSNGSTPVTLTYAGGAAPSVFNAEIRNDVNGGGGPALTLVVSTGTLVLTRDAQHTGQTTINAGATLQLGQGNGGNLNQTSGVVNNGSLVLNHGGASLNAVVSGTGTVWVTGGNYQLNAANTYTGGTNVNGGILQFSNLGNLGTGAIRFGGGTLRWVDQAVDISTRTVTFNAGGGTLDTNGRDVTLANPVGNGGAGGLTKTGGGTLTVNATPTYTGPTAVNNGTLLMTTAFQASSGLSATDGGVFRVTAGGNKTMKFGTLNVANGGRVDANDARFVFTSATPAAIRPLLQSGRNGGDWNGNGFTSSIAADTVGDPNRLKAIGYATAGQLGVTSWGSATGLAAGALLTRLTVYGDLNIDGAMTRDDLALIDRGFALYSDGTIAGGAAVWTDGDVNYDGAVDSTDYLMTDTSYALLGGGLSPALLAERGAQFGEGYVQLLVAAVPEPSGALPVAGGLLMVARRRRRRVGTWGISSAPIGVPTRL